MESGEALEKAAREGDAESQYQLAQLLETSGDTAAAGERWSDWCKRAADQGHLGAMFALGTSLLDGDGIDTDVEGGLSWLERASEAGDEHAAYSLALLHWFGDRVPEDEEKGRRYARLAAERDHGRAQVMVAADRLDDGSPEAVDEAQRWLARAADKEPQNEAERELWTSTFERLGQSLRELGRDAAEVDGWLERLRSAAISDAGPPSVPLDAGLEAFVREIVRTEDVFFLEDPEGGRATGTAEERGHELMLVWSAASGAQAILDAAGEALADYKIETEHLFEFLGATLPELDEAGLHVVANCTSDLSGVDVDPELLRRRIFSLMSSDQREKFDALASETAEA